MGLVSRLGNLWRGFLSLWISDIEKEHPEIAYENAINSMVAKYSKLKTATAAIIRRREDLDERVQAGHRPSWPRPRPSSNAAVETNQDDLARDPDPEEEPARRRRGRAEGRDGHRAGRRRLARRPRCSACSPRSGSSRPSAIRCWPRCSRRRRASGSRSSSMVCRWMPKSRRSTTCASTSRPPSPRRTSARSCSESSLDSRLAALRNQTGDVQAKQQLAELKAKKAAQQAAAGQKTM